MPILKIDEYDSMYSMVKKCRDGETDMPASHRASLRNYQGSLAYNWVQSATLDIACDRACTAGRKA